MSIALFRGVIVPFITPFKEDYSLDLEAAKWLAKYQEEREVDGIFPYSTTGEFVHLTKDEGIVLVKAIMESVSNKVKIIPGISSNSTIESIELGKTMKDLGADGVIVTPPFFFKLDYKKLKLHFSTIAEKVDLPIIIYNIPMTTGVNIPVELYKELTLEYDNIVGAKITYDSITYIRRLIFEVKSIRKEFCVLTGLDDHFLNTLMMGGDGGIMALANFAPQIHVSLYNAIINEDYAKAKEYFQKIVELSRIYDLATSFPTAVKTALKVMGAPIKPFVRPPLTTEPPETETKIKEIINNLGLKIESK
ncbi:MAG: dihydrodipicolinate synthase family protein [Thermoprotei archaeon]|jgi:4-hydroxy-tetrahydrodipicolinate synthase